MKPWSFTRKSYSSTLWIHFCCCCFPGSLLLFVFPQCHSPQSTFQAPYSAVILTHPYLMSEPFQDPYASLSHPLYNPLAVTPIAKLYAYPHNFLYSKVFTRKGKSCSYIPHADKPLSDKALLSLEAAEIPYQAKASLVLTWGCELWGEVKWRVCSSNLHHTHTNTREGEANI